MRFILLAITTSLVLANIVSPSVEFGDSSNSIDSTYEESLSPGSSSTATLSSTSEASNSSSSTSTWDTNDNTTFQCKDGEIYYNCGTTCERTCDDYDNTCKYCTFQCLSGCFCKPELVRAKNGSCILPEECPIRTCVGPNEYFDECPQLCPAQNCSIDQESYDCLYQSNCCQPQCRCTQGFLRNELSICIPEKECQRPTPPPDACGEFEVWSTCTIACPAQTCNSMNSSYFCYPMDDTCHPGCNCIKGYLRNVTLDDPCVPITECPPPVFAPKICLVNEVETQKYNSCAEACKTRFRSDHSPCLDWRGCKCKEGFLRHDNGTCVPIDECSPPICNGDEYYAKMGPSCEKNCTNYDNTCSTFSSPSTDGCFCKPGLVRADDGETCIKPEQCNVPTCGLNEHFDTCPDTCIPQTCKAQLSSEDYDCANAEKCCEPQCRCDEGFLRNDGGICVRDSDCS